MVAEWRNTSKSHNVSLLSDGLSIVVIISRNPKGYKASAWLAKTAILYLCNKIVQNQLTEKEEKIIKNGREVIMKKHNTDKSPKFKL